MITVACVLSEVVATGASAHVLPFEADAHRRMQKLGHSMILPIKNGVCCCSDRAPTGVRASLPLSEHAAGKSDSISLLRQELATIANKEIPSCLRP